MKEFKILPLLCIALLVFFIAACTKEPMNLSATGFQSGLPQLRSTSTNELGVTLNMGLITMTSSTAGLYINSHVTTTKSLTVKSLNTANCDVLADTNGLFYCGTNGTGSGGSNWSFIPGTLSIRPSTTVGVVVSASSTFIGNFKVDGRATTTGSLSVGSVDNASSLDFIDDLYVAGSVEIDAGAQITGDLTLVGVNTDIVHNGVLNLKPASGLIFQSATSTFTGSVRTDGNATTTLSHTFSSYQNCNLDTDANGLLVCGTDNAGGGSYPFTFGTTYETATNVTTTPIWFRGSPISVFASSTLVADFATTTALTVSQTLFFDGLAFDSLTDDATLDNNSGDLRVVDVTCTDCLNATEIEDIYFLTAGDTMASGTSTDSFDANKLGLDSTFITSWDSDATIAISGGALQVVDVTCTDCLNATEIEDIYLLNNGDSGSGVYTWSGLNHFQAGQITTGSSTNIGYFKIEGNATTTGGLVVGTTVPGTNPLPAGHLFVGGSATTTATSTAQGFKGLNLIAASCDIKATAAGDLYCGTDSTGGASIIWDSFDTQGLQIIAPTNTLATLAIGAQATSTADFYVDTQGATATTSVVGHFQIASSTTGYTLFKVSDNLNDILITGNATGTNAVKIGPGTIVSNAGGIAIGNNAKVVNSASDGDIAIGDGARAGEGNGSAKIAIGKSAVASNDQAIAIGSGSSATNEGGVAIGESATTNGLNTFAGGFLARANADSAVMIGQQGNVTGAGSIALGAGATVLTGVNSIAIGLDSLVNTGHDGSIALGANAVTLADNQLVIGNSATPITNALIYSSSAFTTLGFSLTNFGIGTTTPFERLSVVGGIVSDYINATSTFATSTFSGGLSFMGEIAPDGTTCAVGQILKKTGADDWDCAADVSGSGAYSFTESAAWGQNTSATGTTMWLRGSPFSLFASSTSVFDFASTTALTISGTLFFDGLAFDSLTDDATLDNNSGDLRVVDVTCTDCLNATEIEDIYLLDAGDTLEGDLNMSTFGLTNFFGTACTGNEFLQDIADDGAFTCGEASGSLGVPNLISTSTNKIGGALVGSAPWVTPSTTASLYVSQDIFIDDHGTTTDWAITGNLYFDANKFDSLTDDATLDNNAGDLRVVDVTCTDCLNATELEDIYFLTAGDIMANGTSTDSFDANKLGLDSAFITSWDSDATIAIASGALQVVDVTCTDCLNATEIEDIFLLIAGDSSSGNYTWTGVHDFGGGVIEITNGTTPTVDAIGEIALDTDMTTGHKQLVISTSTDATGPAVIPLGLKIPVHYASTTWTGTTTINYGGGATHPFQLNSVYCFSNTGTAIIRVGDGTNWSNPVTISSTQASTTLTTNATFTYGEKTQFQIGTPLTSVANVGCTFEGFYNRL